MRRPLDPFGQPSCAFAFPEPANARTLVAYLSYDDLVESLRCSLMTARVGHTILFGVSGNPGKWWDNRKASAPGTRSGTGSIFRRAPSGASILAPAPRGPGGAERAGLVAERAHHVPVRLAPVAARGMGFRLRPDTGTPSGRRVFVDMNQHPGRPDGAAIDIDDCYWTCANDAGQLHRFTPKGELDRSIALPVAKPSMCSFGGGDMKTMLVTSISAGAPVGDRLAGAVWTLDPGVAGMPEQRFDFSVSRDGR